MSKIRADTEIISVQMDLQPREAERLAAVLYHMETSNDPYLSEMRRKLKSLFPDVSPNWAIITEEGGRYVNPLLVPYPPGQ